MDYPVTLGPTLLAQARAAEIVRVAERAANVEAGGRARLLRATASRWSADVTRPATGSGTAGTALLPVPCCA